MESSLIADLVSRLPPHLSSPIDGLLRRPVATREHMLAELEDYTRLIDDAARRRPDLDVDLAEAIVSTCRALLDGEWARLSDDQRRLIQVACDYYVDPDDEDGDLDSVFGFDDDAEVLNLVLDALQRSELKVRV